MIPTLEQQTDVHPLAPAWHVAAGLSPGRVASDKSPEEVMLALYDAALHLAQLGRRCLSTGQTDDAEQLHQAAGTTLETLARVIEYWSEGGYPDLELLVWNLCTATREVAVTGDQVQAEEAFAALKLLRDSHADALQDEPERAQQG